MVFLTTFSIKISYPVSNLRMNGLLLLLKIQIPKEQLLASLNVLLH